MLNLKPNAMQNNIFNITPKQLGNLGVLGVILDIDDTIIARHEKVATKETILWLKNMQKEGFKVVIVSNNFKKRVEKISRELGVVCFSFSLKPLTLGINKAIKHMELPREKVCVIGDQLFTDVLGAKIAKTKVILVEPLSQATSFTLKIKRRIENHFKKKF